MKNNLLLTTALVSVAFAFTANAAEDTATHKVTQEDDLTVSGTLNGLHAGDKTDAQGGAVYHGHGLGELTVEKGTTFSNNYAQQTGGAISAYSDVHIGDNVTFKNNTSIMNETEPKFNDNNGKAKSEMGGAIYVEGTGSNSQRKLTIGDNVRFEGNKAGSGTVYLYNGVTAVIGDNVSFVDNIMGESHATKPASGVGALTLAGKNDVTIGNNALFARNEATFGAAVGIDNNASTLTFGENTTFSGNKAKNSGGAIYNGGKITFNGNVVFENNTATTKGGAIFNVGKLEFDGNTVFSNNSANGKLNDIYNHTNANINVGEGASLTLDGGITGSGSTLTLEKDSTLTVKDTTKVESLVKSDYSLVEKDDYNYKPSSTVQVVITDKTMESGNLQLTGTNGIFTNTDQYSDWYTPSGDGHTNSVYSRSVEHMFDNAVNNLYTFEKKGNSSKDVSYTVKERSAGDVANRLGVKEAEAATLLATSSSKTGSGNKAFDDIQDTLRHEAQYGNNSALLSRSADALVADAAPTVRVRETMLSNMIFDTATDAMDDALTNAAVGQSSGDSLVDKAKVWVKGLFNYADRDDTNKSHGFDIDTYGVAFGLDKNVSPSVKLGAGYAYSQSDIDGYTRDTDVDTHTLFAYAKYKPANWYVNTVASYSFSDYKEKKSVLSYSADAKYDVDTFGLQSVYGYELNTNGYEITPEAGLRYLHIAKEGYVDELGTMAVSKNTNVLTAIAGVKAAKTFELSNGLNIRPEVRAAVTYDLTSDNNDTRVVLPNGEALKVAGEDFDRFGFELGAKLATDITSNWEVAAGYEGRFREDYSDHTGILSAKYRF